MVESAVAFPITLPPKATPLKRINSASFGGYSDWRLPNINEMIKLINFDVDEALPLLPVEPG